MHSVGQVAAISTRLQLSAGKATGRLTVRALEESFAEFGVPQVLPLPRKLSKDKRVHIMSRAL